MADMVIYINTVRGTETRAFSITFRDQSLELRSIPESRISQGWSKRDVDLLMLAETDHNHSMESPTSIPTPST